MLYEVITEFYTEEMTELAFERVVMETSMRLALQNEEFVVYYQPKYHGVTNTIIGMEALIRWRHPSMGLVSPAKFIPLAEETGFIIALDRWVMRQAMSHRITSYNVCYTKLLRASGIRTCTQRIFNSFYRPSGHTHWH